MKVQVLSTDPKIKGQRQLCVGDTYVAHEVHWCNHGLMSVGIKVGRNIIALWADQLKIVER